jgi:tRNA A-37 threonylcarbamoyl transferase component Bud32
LPESRSILTITLRDPEANMVEGERPRHRRAQQPLTRLAVEAVQGKDGHDADGYRDYRGVPSVGAWRWLPEFDFGIGTEVDVTEAFRPVYILRTVFWVLMTLLILSALGIFVAMLYIARQQKALQKATLAARQLGQYALEEKIGAGGMGTVYKARHAMLRRPTAIKLLDVEKISPSAVARFEREVQMTSALTHPNTVAVYDYGRTPEGIFYYAMEYLDGMNLDELVQRSGLLSEERMVYILRQVCGALAEAHAAGLVHRDIKPANIFLTRRGGLYDFVKVLDFGLVKALDDREAANVTNPHALLGTPLYLSPEAVSDPDAVDVRADVYAVGAVAYFMLTGSAMFSGNTVVEICMKHVHEVPQPPSVRSGKPVNPHLEELILRCLAKSPMNRPRNAAELLGELESCVLARHWTATDAAAWWAQHQQTDGRPAADLNETRMPDSPPVDATVAYQTAEHAK